MIIGHAHERVKACDRDSNLPLFSVHSLSSCGIHLSSSMLRKAATPLLNTNCRCLRDTQWLSLGFPRCKSTLVQQSEHRTQRSRPKRADTTDHERRTSPRGQGRSIGNSSKDTEPEKRLLSPYVLSGRLRELFESGQPESAVELLKTQPLDAQSTAVWNTVIKELLERDRLQFAYKQYVDVR